MASRSSIVALLGLLGAGALFAGGCGPREQVVRADPRRAPARPRAKAPETLQPLVRRDLDDIRKKKTLVVLAPYNSTSYFLYKGEPMGYEYELLKAFANDHKLGLRVVVVRNGDELVAKLNRGEGDVLAARLIPSEDPEAASKGIAFTRGLYRTKPVLVQEESGRRGPALPEPVEEAIHDKKVENPEPGHGLPDSASEETRTPAKSSISARLITRPSQLKGQKVTLPKGSAYLKTLVELEDEISGDIQVAEIDGRTDAEDVMERVSKGEVDLTVAQENLAELKESVFTNLAVIPTLGPSHAVSWAVRRNSPQLRAALDHWIEKNQEGSLFRSLYRKYFIDQRRYRERVQSEYLTSKTGKLSRYDPLLKRYSGPLEWDWRLLASLAYQESRFDPAARSWAGASGLLQLMPATARGFGCRNRSDPEQNVRGGTRFLSWLKRYWRDKIPDEAERLKFVIGSYNAGPGHIEDARRLARKHGDDANVWDDVAYWLLQLSQKKYYADPVVRFGFVRGVEPVTYVGVILERYDHYRQFVVT